MFVRRGVQGGQDEVCRQLPRPLCFLAPCTGPPHLQGPSGFGGGFGDISSGGAPCRAEPLPMPGEHRLRGPSLGAGEDGARPQTQVGRHGGSRGTLGEATEGLLQRGDRDTPSSSWRPAALHRTAARKWALAIDCKLRMPTDKGGIAGFQVDTTKPAFQDRRRFPLLVITSDLGSDGLSGFNALSRGLGVSCVLYPDPSHTCQRALENSLRQAGL